MSDNVKKWVRAAGVRAVKTVAQTAVATISSAAVAYGRLCRPAGWYFVIAYQCSRPA